MAEHSERYARLAAALNRAGFIVWAHDHRGHGRNPTPPVGLGHFADADGWNAVVSDAAEVSALMQAAHPGLPLFLFAHSMGSFMAQALMRSHGARYTGVVLCGSCGSPNWQEGMLRLFARAERALRGARARGTAVATTVFGRYNAQFRPTRTYVDWLSRDTDEVDKYIADPYCGFALTTQSWVDFLEGKASLGSTAWAQAVPKNLPVYLIAGSRDPVGESLAGVRRLLTAMHEAGMPHVTHAFYEEARHELVNETNRDDVTGDLVGWLQRSLP